MTKLYLYTIFHLNLAYSSILEKDYPVVIERCFWPLLNICEKTNVPIGIEASGYTLEKINEISSSWINKLKVLWENGACEFIGSGYAQIIGPLVPAEVNSHNLKIGHQVYQSLLGRNSQIAYVSEQAYSAGLVEHYINAGYKAIIMEWNNPYRYHPEWSKEWQYYPQLAVDPNEKSIPVIWNNSIAFQKFQRYVHSEIELEEYFSYLESHMGDSVRAFPLYGNDVEVFNFRPGRYRTESEVGTEEEWERIRKLFERLKADKNFQFSAPSDVLNFIGQEGAGQFLRLESAEQPIPIKKQEKYNINRWALTGRDDLGINTKCYQIYDAFKKAKLGEPTEEDWKELCYLWSSDFRTHITQKRWDLYLPRLNQFCEKWGVKQKSFFIEPDEKTIELPYLNEHFEVQGDARYVTVETESMKCVLNKVKGLAIDNLWFKNISTEPLIGTLPHGYYDDISLGADFYSGHIVIEKPGEHKITDLQKCKPKIFLKEESLLCVRAEIQDREVKFKKEYLFDISARSLTIKQEIEMPGRMLLTIHPLNITFIPTSFQKESLFYATHNGGKNLEKFKMGSREIYHAQSLSSLISAKHGLGATEGVVIVGDEKIQIIFQHDQTKSAVIPSVHFLPLNNGLYFLRLQYSAQEMDETFKENPDVCKLSFCWKISL